MIPYIGPFRWECVTCPKGIIFVTSVVVTSLFTFIWYCLSLSENTGRGASHITPVLPQNCCPFLSQYTDKQTSIFSLPEFSMILLAELRPLPQLHGNC